MKKILFVCLLALSFCSIVLPTVSVQAASKDTAQANKQLVESFWNELFNKHNVSVLDNAVGSTYIQHNPTFPDGKEAFKIAVAGFLKEFPESGAEIKHIVAEKNYVSIHNHIKLNPQDRGQAAVDIFRVENGKIVEHWDVIQDIPEKSENGNAMF
ncbi:ester cyclase [Sporomusa aerivorans]|uniref:nuclear transport factor 2 family protein n=1 Tax=Sporomusa aerivorans TaxID=204936 RepID=UPI00352A9AE2